jgi:hypothetical protein
MEEVMRRRIEITWRGPANCRDECSEIVTDLAAAGELLRKGPIGWVTAYVPLPKSRTPKQLSDHCTAPKQLEAA